MAANITNNYVLLHAEDNQDVLNSPLKSSSRIKEGAVTLLSISASEKCIAFATKKNTICTVELNENTFGKLITRSEDLSDSTITALQWSADDNTLFVGDSEGRLSMLELPFLNRSIFHLPSYILTKFDSKIVQIMYNNNLLLISTLSRCYVCDTVNHHYKQIGEKLRDGVYGACFMNISDKSTKIFCARPGSRLWEVDLDGTVHSTQELKQALAIPPTPFISIYKVPKIVINLDTDRKWLPQSFNFAKLFSLGSRFIFTYKVDGIYIFDVQKAAVLLWTDYFRGIIQAVCFGEIIYLWTVTGSFHIISLLTLEKCLLNLYFRKQYGLCSDIIRLYHKLLLASDISLELVLLSDLETHIDKNKICNNFLAVIDKIKTMKNTKCIETQSGMYFVNNEHFSRQVIDGKKLPTFISRHRQHHSLERTNCERNLKRSHSLSLVSNGNDHQNYEKPNGAKFDTTERVSDNINIFPKDPRSQLEFDKLLIEMNMYPTPFLTLASYDILQDTLAELGTNVTEILNIKSKNLIDKLDNLHMKLNPFSKKKIVRNPVENDAENQLSDMMRNNNISDEYIDAVTLDDTPIIDIVEVKQAELPAIDCSKILEMCTNLNFENDSDCELIREIIEKYFVYSSVENISNIKDYFPFSSYFSKNIIQVIKERFNRTFDSGCLRQWLCMKDLITVNDSVNTYYPLALQKIHNQEDLVADFIVRKIILIFSELLDPYTITQNLKSLNIPCYYLSLTYILDYFQNGCNTDSKVRNKEWPLPVFLNTMLLMLSLDQAETFYQMGIKQNIDLCDVSYLILTIDGKNANLSENIYLTYVTKYITSNSSNIDNVFNNSVVLYHVLYQFFKTDIIKGKICDCGFPIDRLPSKIKYGKIGTALLKYFWNICEKIYNKHEDASCTIEFLYICNNLISESYHNDLQFCHKNYENCDHKSCEYVFRDFKNTEFDNISRMLILSYTIIFSLCIKSPFSWHRVSEMQKYSNFKMLYIEHFIQLGMMLEIEPFLKDTISIQQIIDLSLRVSEGYCLNCGSLFGDSKTIDFSWTDLFLMILKILGVDETTSILLKLHNPPSLDQRWYQSCIAASIVRSEGVEAQQKVISAISDLDYVSHISNEVREEIIDAYNKDLKQCDSIIKSKVSDRHHWGTQVKLSEAICYGCSLSLFSEKILQEENAGFIIFSCHHSYHSICLKSRSPSIQCLYCKK